MALSIVSVGQMLMLKRAGKFRSGVCWRARNFSVRICRAETDRKDSQRIRGWRRRCSLTVLPPFHRFANHAKRLRQLGAGA